MTKKRLKNPRTGLALTRTQCNGAGCTASCAGRLWPSDRHWYCPKCEGKTVGDKESRDARFAPSRRGPFVPPEDPPESEDVE